MNGIFISYRRDDSAGYAGRLYDRLVTHFGVERVFMDVEGIEPGTDFVEAIERAIASCRVLIVLIGDEWLSAADTGGRRRLDDPNDFIRLETSAALARDIRVVPVLLDGALMPHENDLPDNLKSLVRRQAVELTHKQWEASSGELIRTLERILGADDAPEEEVAAVAPRAAVSEPKTNTDASSGEAHHSKTWMIGFIAAIGVAIGMALFLRDKPKPAPEPMSVAQPTPASPDKTPPPEAAPSAPAAAAPEPAPQARDVEPTIDTPAADTPAQASSPPGRPELRSATAKLRFDETTIGERSRASFGVTNSGQSNAEITARIVGESPTSFGNLVTTCGESLPPKLSCGVSVDFTPTTAGPASAELVFEYGATAPLVIPIEATAKAAGQAPVEAPALPVTETPPAMFEHFGGPIAEERQATSVAKTRPAAEAPPPPSPVIQTLTSTPVAGGAEICYRAEHADSLVLAPQPGDIGNSPSDCITVPLLRETTLTLVAVGPGGQAAVRVNAVPAPSTVAEASPPVADTPESGDSADTALPARGDTWTYRSRGKWATSPKRTIIFEVENVASGVITERYLEIAPMDLAGPAKRSRAGDAAIIDWGAAGWEFSPWLAAANDYPESKRWRGFSAPAMNREWGNWSTTASVSGKSRITVPAGTFTTLRVEASASRAKTGGRAQAMVEPVQVKFTVWYSPKVKRYVKMERSVISASRREIEQDTFELVEYITR